MPALSDTTVFSLVGRTVTGLEAARARVVRTANSEMVLVYWHIGREIVEQTQKGSARADYGEQLLESLAHRLGQRLGRGFSTTNLKHFRLFYQAYSDREPRIRHKPCDVSSLLASAVKGTGSLEGFYERPIWSH